MPTSNAAPIFHVSESTTTTTSSNVTSFYFSVVLVVDKVVEGLHRCRCGIGCHLVPRSGFSNLIAHIRDQHPDFHEVMREEDTGAGTLAPWFHQRVETIYGWMDWVLTNNLSER